MTGNLYRIPAPPLAEERFDVLADGGAVCIERIVSAGHTTPPDTWYDQARDEWVVLLQGEASVEFEDGGVVRLGPGDHLLIPAHDRHRVASTSREPPCIWLAVHADLRKLERG